MSEKYHFVPTIVGAFLCLSLLPLIAQEDRNEKPPPRGEPPFAGKTIDQLTADDVLQLVRYSYTLYNRDFTGQLRMGIKDKIPFLLSLKPESIRFIFSDPPQVIYLDTRDNGFSLYQGIGGKELQEVSPDQYGERIRKSDVTYDDLSMRFLYWPNAKIAAEEVLKGRKTWKVVVRNPNGRGAYATVDCWIDKISGGLIKMIGYNRQGRPIRRFEVLHGKKFGDIWMVDEMRIETISPKNGKILSSTRMQIKQAVE